MKSINWLVANASACAILLTACGGGGGSAGNSPFNPNAGTATAADLSVSPSATQLGNTPSSKVTLTVTALDSGKRAVPEIPVTVSVDNGSDAVVTQVNTKTDTQGKVTADVSVGANRANRLVNLVVTSGSITKTTSIQVVGASITATVTPPVLDPGAAGTVRYRVVDQTSNAMSGQAVQVTAVGLTPPTINAVTDSNGEYVFRYTAPAAIGAYTIAATISGATNEQIVNVQPASTVPSASGAIVSASVSANPSVVPVNTSGTQNRAEIRALFLGSGNTPIRNVRARFDLNGDANSIGGSIVSGSTILYSDTNGVATTAYVPAARTSPTDGLTVRVCYGTTDAALANGACPNAAFVTLTVINDALGVTIGTDNRIEVNTARLTYIRKYVVQVVDSAGLAKADVNITASVDLPRYLKGSYTPPPVAPPAASGAAPAPAIPWSWTVTAVCVNEDTNRNGVLEAGEDIDGDIRLEPGKSDVAVQLLDTKTGPDGKALIQIEYPQNFATWVSARVTVSASGVLGTEGRASFLEDPVGAPADAVKDAAVAPPFVISPYGITNSCTNPN
jgi:hypothetical protein